MGLRNFNVVSVNYKDFTLEQREEFLKRNYKERLKEYFFKSDIKGYVILETCLRIEIYFEKSHKFSSENFLKDMGLSRDIKIFNGEEALKYLMNVSCGLESVIKGEDQILSQLKKSYSENLEKKKTSKILNTIFNKAIQTGKKFRTVSKINTQNLSLDGISVKFIREKFKDFSEKKVFIIGIGELSQSILALLYKIGVKEIAVTNRTRHKSLEVNHKYKDIKLVYFSDKYKEIKDSDIIISATSAPHLVIKADKLELVVADVRERFFLDLAVPRDIDPKIATFKNTTLCHLEDLWEVYNNNLENRENISEKYSYVIEEQIEKTKKWFDYRKEIVGENA